MVYRHHDRGGIDFADTPKQRMPNGMLTDEAHKAFEAHRDIAELLCPICRKYLIHEADLYNCHWCGVAGEVVLVVDRLVADDDPQRVSIRLRQQRTLSPKAWQHAEANNGFLISDLPCPSCDAPITRLIEHDDGVQPSCCQFAFIPGIKELFYRKSRGRYMPRWQIFYEEVEKIGIPQPTLCEIKCIDLYTYRSEMTRLAPKIQTPAVESEGVPHRNAQTSWTGCVGQPSRAVSPSETLEPPQQKAESDTPPNATDVSKAKTLSLRGTDAIHLFLRTFIIGEPKARTPRNEVYEAYTAWIRQDNQPPLHAKTFHKHLKEVFPYVAEGQNRIDGKRVWCYRGIKVRADAAMGCHT